MERGEPAEGPRGCGVATLESFSGHVVSLLSTQGREIQILVSGTRTTAGEQCEGKEEVRNEGIEEEGVFNK